MEEACDRKILEKGRETVGGSRKVEVIMEIPRQKCCQVCEFFKSLQSCNICTRNAPQAIPHEGHYVPDDDDTKLEWAVRRPNYPSVHPQMVCGEFVFDIDRLHNISWRFRELTTDCARLKKQAEEHFKQKAVLSRKIKRLEKRIEKAENVQKST